MGLTELVEDIRQREAMLKKLANESLRLAAYSAIFSGLILYSTESPATEIMLSVTGYICLTDAYGYIQLKNMAKRLRENYPSIFKNRE